MKIFCTFNKHKFETYLAFIDIRHFFSKILNSKIFFVLNWLNQSDKSITNEIDNNIMTRNRTRIRNSKSFEALKYKSWTSYTKGIILIFI